MKIYGFHALAWIMLLGLWSCGGSGTGKTGLPEVNVYTHRHYQADDSLFSAFTRQTGIKVNIVQAGADELIQRLETEGAHSPADVLITVDAGRLCRAQERGLLQPVHSEILEQNIPARFREPEGYWFGVSFRARIIVYAKDRVNPERIRNYSDLANPEWKGRLLIRSSSNIYNQSLAASVIAAEGADRAAAWARGVVANMARQPKGSDRDQIKAIAAGEGDIAVVNSYYIGLMLHDSGEEVRRAGESVGIIFPDQDGRGTHVNISGIGLTSHAPNRDNAVKLMEFLSGAEAQQILAGSNYEYPVLEGISWSPLLQSWGAFRTDTVRLSELGRLNAEAVQILDQSGWK